MTMRLSCLALSLLLSVSFTAQTTFTREWKTGDHHDVMVTEKTTDQQDDGPEDVEEMSYLMTVDVLDRTAEHVDVRFMLPSPAQKVLEGVGKEAELDVPTLTGIPMTYRYSLTASDKTLIDWETSRDGLVKAHQEAAAWVDKQGEDVSFAAGFALAMLEPEVASADDLDDYMDLKLTFLDDVYYQPMELGKTVENKQSEANPFAPNQDIDLVIKTTLESMGSGTAVVREELIYDMSQFMDMMRQMMMAMMEGMTEDTASEEMTEEQKQKMDEGLAQILNIKMEMTAVQTTTLDTATSWPKEVKVEVVQDGTDEHGTPRRSAQYMTYTFK